MAALSLSLPILARCERPSAASERALRVQPGRLAQGPDEKCGTRGRAAGAVFAIDVLHPCRWARRVGAACPVDGGRMEGVGESSGGSDTTIDGAANLSGVLNYWTFSLTGDQVKPMS